MTGRAGSIRDQLLLGQLEPDLAVVDAHAHLGGWFNFPIPHGEASGMLRTMDACGIRAACISSFRAIAGDTRDGNLEMAEAVRAHPDRFYGHVVMSPHDPPELSLEELRHWIDEGLARGIKLHPGVHGYPITGPAYRLVWEFAAARKLPVLIHTWKGEPMSEPPMIAPLAAAYPDITFVLGHAGGTWQGYNEAAAVAKQYPNVFLEICMSRPPFGTLEWLVAEIGPQQILFGTDQPFFDPRPQLGRVAFARISEEAKRLILGGNARRLLGA